METITSLAESILKKRQEKDEAIGKKIRAWREQKEQAILDAFKSAFYDFIPLLEKEGIGIDARFKTAWEYQGSYILFRKGNNILKMDFSNALSYRYEYTKPGEIGRSVYGTWPKEDFVLFIYNWLKRAETEENCPVLDNRTED